MTATAIEVSDLRAVVELRPCWLARLFGARTERVEILRLNSYGPWRTKYGEEPLSLIEHGSIILRALDFRPVALLPIARARP